MTTATNQAFSRYIGIDYSGAETPTSRLQGLRVYLAKGEAPAEEVLPSSSKHKYLSRLHAALNPNLNAALRTLASVEGWILGVA